MYSKRFKQRVLGCVAEILCSGSLCLLSIQMNGGVLAELVFEKQRGMSEVMKEQS